jgi:hypothetical protein
LWWGALDFNVPGFEVPGSKLSKGAQGEMVGKVQ